MPCPILSHVHKRKGAVGQARLLINSFNKHLSLLRGLLFPAKDGSCLSGSTEGSPELPGSARHTMTGTEGSGSEVSGQQPNRGSAFVNSGKERRGGREVLSNCGGSCHLFRIAAPSPPTGAPSLSRDLACFSGCSFSTLVGFSTFIPKGYPQTESPPQLIGDSAEE